MKYSRLVIIMAFVVFACATPVSKKQNRELAERIKGNEYFSFVKNKALEVVKTGFNAGDSYGEVWIRDYNTFIELSAEVFGPEVLKENLIVFFRLQGNDGNIIDGFIPKESVTAGGYEYIYSDLEPRYAGHKNTVETDHESSLIQALYKYVMLTGDTPFWMKKLGIKPWRSGWSGQWNFF
jgi:hypothetical protein